MALQGTIRPSVHSRQRGWLRYIHRDDVEAAINSQDARVISHNPGHPEGTSFEIVGRRADGGELHIVIAFDTTDPTQADEMIVVTVMHPEGESI
jgi:hypothetical protein